MQWLCNPNKAKLSEFTFRLDPTDDYVNCRLMMRFWDGVHLDSKQADLDFVPDDIIPDIITFVRWMEAWEDMTVFTIRVYNMRQREREFEFTMAARGAPGTLVGRFARYSDSLTEEIRDIIIRWWRDMEAAYGRRPMGIGIPLDDVRPGTEDV